MHMYINTYKPSTYTDLFFIYFSHIFTHIKLAHAHVHSSTYTYITTTIFDIQLIYEYSIIKI